ncbi:MAG: ATP-binding protein [Deltaproteobacteria bacterium]|nr:ATP-binding protein [Deltaproteobacteria bacterium]
MMTEAEHNGRTRIVLTGGPGGGKSTAADMFRREIGDRVVVVPEAATILYGGGFPRPALEHARRSTQQAIFHVQRNLEDVQARLYPDRVLLCDRGTIDGAAYWPGSPDDFFNAMGTTLAREFERYDAVIHFESAAAGGIAIEGGNPVRNETLKEALLLDRKLQAIWSAHPHFHVIPHNASFLAKITQALRLLQSLVDANG